MITTYPMLSPCPYRVGDILQTFNAEHPATSWPGTTWERLDDRMLIGAGTTYALNATGGETSHKHTTQSHKLTAAESGLPGHTHKATSFHYLANAGNSINTSGGNWSQNTYATQQTGPLDASQAHSHGDTGSTATLPPYRACYMYKRLT